MERDIVQERLHPLLARRNDLTYGRLFLDRSLSSFEVSLSRRLFLDRSVLSLDVSLGYTQPEELKLAPPGVQLAFLCGELGCSSSTSRLASAPRGGLDDV